MASAASKRFLPKYAFKNPLKRLAIWIFDAIGFALFFPFKIFRKPLEGSKIRKILAIRLDHLGDVLMTRPALEALHQRFPNAQIDFLVAKEIAPLFEDAREIRELIPLEHHWFCKDGAKRIHWDEIKTLVERMQKSRYDLAIDFRGDLRNIFLMAVARIPERWGYGITGGGFLLTHCVPYSRSKHQVQLCLDLLKDLEVSSEIQVEPLTYSGTKKWKFWNTFAPLLEKENKPRIVIHAGAGYSSKRWPMENFQKLIQHLGAAGNVQIILIGTESEKAALRIDTNGVVDLRGLTQLADLPILLDASNLFVGNDSGPAHLAAAQGLPTIVLFSGTNRPENWKPRGPHVQILQHEVPCSPCESPQCPLKHHDCMVKISVDEVHQVIRATLSRL